MRTTGRQNTREHQRDTGRVHKNTNIVRRIILAARLRKQTQQCCQNNHAYHTLRVPCHERRGDSRSNLRLLARSPDVERDASPDKPMLLNQQGGGSNFSSSQTCIAALSPPTLSRLALGRAVPVERRLAVVFNLDPAR